MIRVIGGGLAGTEAALQIAKLGLDVELYEMRPAVKTAAHVTGNLAELVCSNSLKSNEPLSAPRLLKAEMRLLDSLIIASADRSAVPAGMSLSVDREAFAQNVLAGISSTPHIRLCRNEITEIPQDGINIIATGPLTSPQLAESIGRFTGSPYLY